MGRHTDVIEDFVYNSENPRYNRDYLHWRRHTKTQFIYRYVGDSGENVYVEGGTAIRDDAEEAERKSLMHCSLLIGFVMLTYLVAELLGRTLIAAVLRLFGLEVHMDFLALPMKGSQWAETGAHILLDVLKYGVPAFILLRTAKIPKRVAMPVHFGAPPELFAAVGMSMVITGIHCLLSRDADIELSQRLFTYKNMAAVFAFGLFEVLVVPVMAELLMRGGVFQLLRQFGDPFAIWTTACIAFLCPNTLPNRIGMLMIGLACGYLMVRSGSILKCILLRGIYAALVYARLIIVYTTGLLPLWQYTLLLFAFGTLLIAAFVRIRHKKLKPENTRTALNLRKKLQAATQSVTALPWLALAAILTLLQLFS